MSRVVQSSIRDDLLDLAMNLFWEKGFFNTSIEDIVENTGINRATMYKYFGDKRTLFIEMLKRYRQKMTPQFTMPLQNKTMGLLAISAFFDQFIHLDKNDMPCGCFLIATASDIPSHDKEVARFINQFSSDLRAAFLACLVCAVDEKQLASHVDITAVADFLVANVFGLMTLHRTQRAAMVIKNQIAMMKYFLQTLAMEKLLL